MTISTWLMILALATGTSQSIGNNSIGERPSTFPRKIAGECWINGVWTNPCTEAAPLPPNPGPEILTPV
ncbi:MAG TPA: hypothetical protein VJT15_22220 [Pyrinomonadaceae bacterium]|nr:hypothetical protein [Pyrinomonadaceae bacterium]